MYNTVESKNVIVIVTVMFSVFLGILFIQNYNQTAFGFEENILALQSGIISTSNQDYALSQVFEARVFQDGRIMRLSGVTTTGEQYYLYQKIVGDQTIVRGKIFENNNFVPIIFKEEFLEEKILRPDEKLVMAVKLSSFTYTNYPFVISVKVFDGKINPQPNYDSRFGVLENVAVNVMISDRFGTHVTTLSGKTDSFGVFQGKYLVIENVVDQGKYNVEVLIDNGNTKASGLFTTFFRGDITDYFMKN